jgi:hypothetical protein
VPPGPAPGPASTRPSWNPDSHHITNIASDRRTNRKLHRKISVPSEIHFRSAAGVPGGQRHVERRAPHHIRRPIQRPVLRSAAKGLLVSLGRAYPVAAVDERPAAAKDTDRGTHVAVEALSAVEPGRSAAPGLKIALDHEVHLALASTLKLRVLHLDTSSTDLRGWKSAGDSLARRALAP